jgi:hypothetical protein
VQSFSNCSPFYFTPLEFSIFNSYIVDNLNLSKCFSINMSDIKNKCFLIAINLSKAIVIELTHSFFKNILKDV